MHTSRFARSLLTLALATPLAAAAASGSADKPAFKKADANGDGHVTMKEATQAGVPKKEAKREDIDNNGKLSDTDWTFIDMKPGGQSGSSSS